MIEIADVSQAAIRRSSQTSFFRDFQDCIQYNCAFTIKNLSCIVTRDAKDYKKSALSVMTPRDNCFKVAKLAIKYCLTHLIRTSNCFPKPALTIFCKVPISISERLFSSRDI
jgi:hypothetical protein